MVGVLHFVPSADFAPAFLPGLYDHSIEIPVSDQKHSVGVEIEVHGSFQKQGSLFYNPHLLYNACFHSPKKGPLIFLEPPHVRSCDAAKSESCRNEPPQDACFEKVTYLYMKASYRIIAIYSCHKLKSLMNRIGTVIEP